MAVQIRDDLLGSHWPRAIAFAIKPEDQADDRSVLFAIDEDLLFLVAQNRGDGGFVAIGWLCPVPIACLGIGRHHVAHLDRILIRGMASKAASIVRNSLPLCPAGSGWVAEIRRIPRLSSSE